MAEARKLAGNVSEESEVTPRRSFSLNIFLQEGERVKVLVPSCWQAVKQNCDDTEEQSTCCAVVRREVPFAQSRVCCDRRPQLHCF